MRRRRWRTAVLWVGCTLCVLIVVVFAMSAWWSISVGLPGGPYIGCHAGALNLVMPDYFGSWLNYMRHGAALKYLLVGSWHPDGGGFILPLIYPFAAVALPTLLVWWFVPKFPRGHCRRCGYNLTGVTEARCPECGAGFESEVTHGSC